jgi:HlyD family secretion protein
VYVVKGEGRNKTYERKKVVTGLSDGVNIEIRSGLQKIDKVRGPKVVEEDKEG